jgi:hypothetical protein
VIVPSGVSPLVAVDAEAAASLVAGGAVVAVVGTPWSALGVAAAGAATSGAGAGGGLAGGGGGSSGGRNASGST